MTASTSSTSMPRAATSASEVLVGSGWRGPYLRLPVAQENLYDGWGNAFQLTTDTAGQITAVRSLGADAQTSGSGYDADLSVTLNQHAAITVSGNVYLVDGNGTRSNPADASQVVVRMYGPDPSTGGVLETEAAVATGTDGAVGYSFSQTVAPGPHFVRAYLTVGGVTKKSPIVRFVQSDVIHLEIR